MVKYLKASLFNLLLVIASLIFFNIEANAQNVSDFFFEVYSIKDGLSQSRALSVYQDKLGYVWIGTESGLNKFNGYEFKQYKHDINKNSIATGWVRAIIEDENANLWVSNITGQLCYFNREKDSWINYQISTRDSLMKMNPNLPFYMGHLNTLFFDKSNNKIWGGSLITGLIEFDIATKKFKQYLVHPENIIKYGMQETIGKVERLDKENLLIATNEGLKYFNTKSHKFSNFFNNIDSIHTTTVKDFEINGDDIYLATNFGALKYNLKTKTEVVFKNEKNNFNSIVSDKIMSIHYSKKSNYLWLTLEENGIDIVNLTNSKIVHLNKVVSKEFGITEKNYLNIIEDKNNNIWIGGYNGGGVIKYDPGKRKFNALKKDFPNDINLGFSTCWGVFEDSKGHMWVGEYDLHAGIHEIDIVNKTNKEYLHDDNVKNTRPWKFFEDAKNTLYAISKINKGTVLYYKKLSQSNFLKIENLKGVDDDKTGFNEYNTYINNKNELILCGYKPLIISNKEGELILDYLKLPKELSGGILSAKRKSPSELYILNNVGIYIWNENTNNFKCLTSNIKDFLNNKDGRVMSSFQVIGDTVIYLATWGNGLLKFDLKKQIKTYLTEKDGVPNLNLYEMHLGNDKNLWISSNFGIIRFNPNTYKFRSFGPSEGVQDFEFNANSSYASPSQNIYFAGIKGFNYFNPKDIKDDTVPPTVIIQTFKKKDSTIIIESANVLKVQVVKYFENNLSFDFLAFNYRDAAHNKYAYKMEGYDDDWINAGTRRFASYTNLPEGTYTFRVKAANTDGVWNEEGARMIIQILPPPWRTWWAYFFYFVILVVCIYVFAKYREKKQIKKLEDERKNGELAEAKALQERLLPKHNPVIENLDIATYLRTSTEVGGDYYDFLQQPDGSLYTICGDATGHGTPSGMLVSITKAGIIGLPQMAPNKMLSALNTVVKKVDLGILRMSLNIAHLKDNQLTLSSAGMPPYFIYRAHNNTTEEILLSGIPLGSFNKVAYDELTTEFNKGDILAIISDGLAEAPNVNGELFDYTQIQSIITENSHMNSTTLINELMSQVDIWLDGKHNPDDITLVIIKYN